MRPLSNNDTGSDPVSFFANEPLPTTQYTTCLRPCCARGSHTILFPFLPPSLLRRSTGLPAIKQGSGSALAVCTMFPCYVQDREGQAQAMRAYSSFLPSQRDIKARFIDNPYSTTPLENQRVLPAKLTNGSADSRGLAPFKSLDSVK